MLRGCTADFEALSRLHSHLSEHLPEDIISYGFQNGMLVGTQDGTTVRFLISCILKKTTGVLS